MPPKKRFEELINSIEAITLDLANEQTDLETSLKLFRKGQVLIAEARDRLQAIEHEFSVLTANQTDEAES